MASLHGHPTNLINLKKMKAYLAVDSKWGIARSSVDGPSIPWAGTYEGRLDMRWFREGTDNHILWVSKATFKGLPHKFQTKPTVSFNLLTLVPQDPREFQFNQLDPHALGDQHVLIGGLLAYERFLMDCSDIYLTMVHSNHKCDVKLSEALVKAIQKNTRVHQLQSDSPLVTQYHLKVT